MSSTCKPTVSSVSLQPRPFTPYHFHPSFLSPSLTPTASDLSRLLQALGALGQKPRPQLMGALAAALVRALPRMTNLDDISGCLGALADLNLRREDTQVGGGRGRVKGGGGGWEERGWGGGGPDVMDFQEYEGMGGATKEG